MTLEVNKVHFCFEGRIQSSIRSQRIGGISPSQTDSQLSWRQGWWYFCWWTESFISMARLLLGARYSAEEPENMEFRNPYHRCDELLATTFPSTNPASRPKSALLNPPEYFQSMHTDGWLTLASSRHPIAISKLRATCKCTPWFVLVSRWWPFLYRSSTIVPSETLLFFQTSGQRSGSNSPQATEILSGNNQFWCGMIPMTRGDVLLYY